MRLVTSFFFLNLSRYHISQSRMNKSFQGAIKPYLSVQPPISHAQEVMRLYRESLRTLQSCSHRKVMLPVMNVRVNGCAQLRMKLLRPHRLTPTTVVSG